jgi:hypothetical protein
LLKEKRTVQEEATPSSRFGLWKVSPPMYHKVVIGLLALFI